MVPMEETKTGGFNKRRAEGRDKSDRPQKTLQLKVRTLNPANTISYVQVYCFTGYSLFVTLRIGFLKIYVMSTV